MKLVHRTGSLLLITAVFYSCLGIASDNHGSAHWGYSGNAGPNNWSHLSDEFKTCSQGTRQSPIDVEVNSAIQAKLEALQFSYNAVQPEVVNNGHTIQVNYAAGSHVRIAGKEYELLQFHFHTPSENKLAGRSFPMEMHMVHKSADGKLAVVAVFIETGRENEVLKAAWERMPMHAGERQKLADVKLSASQLLPNNKEYAQFNGSLTTPPCSEGVKWVVLKTPIQVSKTQLAKFQTVMGDNARPIQPLNNRYILAQH